MDNTKIKKIIEEFLNHMGVAFTEIEVSITNEPESLTFIIKTPESGLLIGKNGEHFTSLKHIIKKIVQKSAGTEDIKFNLDVNDYQARQLTDLRNKIKIIGDRVISFRLNIELEPMSPFERMIVHSYFSDNIELSTESIGEGRDRRVVIRYSPDKKSLGL